MVLTNANTPIFAQLRRIEDSIPVWLFHGSYGSYGSGNGESCVLEALGELRVEKSHWIVERLDGGERRLRELVISKLWKLRCTSTCTEVP
jgi:hypothetical protein